jgi:arylsulfatase A
MNTTRTLFLGLIFFSLIYSCNKNEVTATATSINDTTVTRPAPPYPHPRQVQRPGPPNIIFVLGDDVGYEMPTFDGGQSYNTSHLDSLAANSMVFTQCHATPLCSPSRVELLSGLYNFRNYLKHGWGVYDTQFISYVKVLQNNGYKTCVVGKWQLGDWDIGLDKVGFDDYCVLNPSGNLYRSPTLLDEFGKLPPSATQNKFSEDITGDYAMNFIDQNKNTPFFMYYSFMLIHVPDQPTPLDANFQSFDDNTSDTTYIGSMTHYLDIKVGILMNKLKADGLDKNTIIVFAGDNGSQGNFHSIYKGKEVAGEKGFPTELGTHVPLLVNWPGHIMPGTNDNLVDFSDFAPTFLDMANIKNKPPGDGVSFYPQLFGQNGTARSWIYDYYDPFPVVGPNGQRPSQPRSFAQDTAYKLYKTDSVGLRAGKFFHFTVDPEEKIPLRDNQLTPAQAAIKQKLQAALAGLP